MGAILADIELTNQTDLALAKRGHISPAEVRRQTVPMLADSGATVMVLPQHVVEQLGLEVVDRKWVSLADGTIQECDVVGPIEVRFENRSMIGSAISMPGEQAMALLGQVQFEEMDLLLDPLAQKLIVNPASPDRARLMAVGVLSRWPPKLRE